MAHARKLTKTLIDGLQPQPKDAIYWDSEVAGFGIKVTPKDRKVFIVMHRPKGHRGAAKKYTIGKYGEWTVHNARNRAQEILVESSKGNDVHAQERLEADRRSSDRINDLVAQFLDKHASQNRTANETRRILHHDMTPTIGKRSIHEITKRDLISIIESVNERGSPFMANRTLAAIRKFFNWCVSRDVIDASPAQGISAPKKEQSRDRTLTVEETRAVIGIARQTVYPFGPIVQLLFMTAQRRDEVGGMRWSEINLDKAVWTIPAERAKNGKAHDVHLSKCAVALMRSMPRFVLPDNSESDLVFTTTGERPVSGFSKAKVHLDKLSGVTDWRLHDIRRTVATELSKIGVPIHIADLILNHKSGTISGVTAVYQRNQFSDERREALDKWCDRIDEIMLNDA